jgi:hypothetical protein
VYVHNFVFRQAQECSSNRTTMRFVVRDVEPDGNATVYYGDLVQRIERLEASGCNAFAGWGTAGEDCCVAGDTTVVDRLGGEPP